MKLEGLFRDIGLPATMSKANPPYDLLDDMAEECAESSPNTGDYAELTADTVRRVLEPAK